jgi:hypothetical protein
MKTSFFVYKEFIMISIRRDTSALNENDSFFVSIISLSVELRS